MPRSKKSKKVTTTLEVLNNEAFKIRVMDLIGHNACVFKSCPTNIRAVINKNMCTELPEDGQLATTLAHGSIWFVAVNNAEKDLISDGASSGRGDHASSGNTMVSNEIGNTDG